ncbi:SAF domain-containing protein [Pseudonocardia spinosispora]|uniref:SAF domain-containing protein n=1 Tax=Pseudonocardia spinosispora TaxID=103441 RepID=UPI0009FD1886|nr:SAF domain-containing protein [Pseudonocardia spinosispora]
MTDTQRPAHPERRGPSARAAWLEAWGWRRAVLARRVLAGLLAVAALVLAVRAPPGSTAAVPVLVTVRDLAPGVTLRAEDVQVREWPPDLAPAGALHTADQVEGRVLAGAAGAGEPLTAPRLAGPELARRASGRADAASVPIRLADAEVVALLSPGRVVDVVAGDGRSDGSLVLASAAIVLTVLPPEARSPGGRGRLVLVAVPRASATKLAAATLGREVTVTLR